MTSKTDTKTLYEELREHYLGDGMNTLPQRKEVMQILELRFTPEEAELALSIPMQGLSVISLPDLATTVGKPEAEVWSMVESLLTKGILYSVAHENTGEEVYSLWEWAYSLITPMWGDGLVDDTKRKVAELREQLWDAGLPFLLNPSSHALSLVMPYEPRIDPDAEVPDYERYSHFIGIADRICVIACGCRMAVEGCRNPVWTCMHFNEQVDYWTKYRRGREISKEEALQLIEDSVRGGLVVTGQNSQEFPFVFCLCCKDCCVILRPFYENHIRGSLVAPNYLPEWDLEKCKACSTCRKACQPGAIGRHLSHVEGERDHMIVMEDRCIGCGVCSAVCPREAITLKRVRNTIPEPIAWDAYMKFQAGMLW
ncbi:MAG: 4Fe-4S binding protein [Dehalococcoidia bacterium]